MYFGFALIHSHQTISFPRRSLARSTKVLQIPYIKYQPVLAHCLIQGQPDKIWKKTESSSLTILEAKTPRNSISHSHTKILKTMEDKLGSSFIGSLHEKDLKLNFLCWQRWQRYPTGKGVWKPLRIQRLRIHFFPVSKSQKLHFGKSCQKNGWDKLSG